MHLVSPSLSCPRLTEIAHSFYLFTAVVTQVCKVQLCGFGQHKVLDCRQPELQSWVCTGLHFYLKVQSYKHHPTWFLQCSDAAEDVGDGEGAEESTLCSLTTVLE